VTYVRVQIPPAAPTSFQQGYIMPTGYTSEIADGQTFEDFVLRCARAFEHCNHQRDEPADAKPYPPQSASHYHKLIAESEAEIQKLMAMSIKEREAYGDMLKKNETEQHQQVFNKAVILLNEYNDMKQKVASWNPPTPNHMILKTFMIQQLDITIEHDCDTSYALKRLTELNSIKPIQFYNKALANLISDVARFNQRMEQEQQSAQVSKEWILTLYESLGIEYQ
jgi:hypothetical protein